jgi:hypothetical protein
MQETTMVDFIPRTFVIFCSTKMRRGVDSHGLPAGPRRVLFRPRPDAVSV